MKLFLRILLKQLVTILFFSILHTIVFAQDTQHIPNAADSASSRQNILRTDSLAEDSLHKKIVQQTPVENDSLQNDSLQNDSLLPGSALTSTNVSSAIIKNDSINSSLQKIVQQKLALQLMKGADRNIPDRDIVFYILIFLLFFLGLVKTSFPKYVNSIFSLSFQATFRQTQTKEQMSQNFYPAIMLNLLFVLCGGLFITQFALFNNRIKLPFWQLFVYSTVILLIIYVVKYAVIKFTGWVFNAKDAATEYGFVVFLINKVLGIIIIPLLFLIAYTNVAVQNVAITIVVCLALFSLAIRYLVSLARIRKNLNVPAFHFFIYLCAVEIMPLLVIYKILFLQASNT